MLDEFRKKLIIGYNKDSTWNKIVIMLRFLRKRKEFETFKKKEAMRIEIDFDLIDDFIYYIKNNNS